MILRICARASLCIHACTRTRARTVHIHALARDAQLTIRLIHAELPRLRSAHGGQTRGAGSGLLLLPTPRGSIHHSPPATVKRSGIPSVLGRGCVSCPECVPGTFTRRGAPLYLSLSPCPHGGNNHTGLRTVWLFLTGWQAQSAF